MPPSKGRSRGGAGDDDVMSIFGKRGIELVGYRSDRAFSFCRSEAEEHDGGVSMMRQRAPGGGDGCMAMRTQDADDRIAQRRQPVRHATDPCRRPVLAEADIPHPMQPILDAPMALP